MIIFELDIKDETESGSRGGIISLLVSVRPWNDTSRLIPVKLRTDEQRFRKETALTIKHSTAQR